MKKVESRSWSRLCLQAIFVLALSLRLFKLNHPDSVVFDEVHFGGFATRYLLRQYYFDVHPPLGKMLIAGIAWLGGFNGDFEFAKIGDSYAATHVPYLWMRSVMATLGSLSIVLATATLIELQIPSFYVWMAGLMMTIDTALITQTRFILLDALLMFGVMASVYTWTKFRGLRHRAFSLDWWTWLSLCGASLGLTLGTKMVGLFTVALIGIATLVDLWELGDKKRGMKERVFWKHFAARFACLAMIPLTIYISSF